MFAAGAVVLITVLVVILIINGPARHGIHLDLYTGDIRSVHESLFSSTSKSIESPNHAWAVDHGRIHRKESSSGWVYLNLYQKPWFDSGRCFRYTIFDVVRQIRQHKAWSEEEKIARLKEYHEDLNALTTDWPPSELMTKWSQVFWPEEPAPRVEADAATPGKGEGRETE